MTKKSKGCKLKQYRVPPEKFLVVVNPWGIYGNFDPADLNHVGAWFSTMLRDDYPEAQVRAIYYQRTHRNIIVELPREVEVEQYLGTHHYSKFFMNAGPCEEVAYLYEYKYATFGDPSDKNFSMGHPLYDNIPPDFPIKYPYPLSSPAPPPPMDVPYARAIPPEVNEKLAARHRARAEPGPSSRVPPSPSGATLDPNRISSSRDIASMRPPSARVEQPNQSQPPTDNGKGKVKDINAPSPATGSFTPYVRPSHLNSMLTDRINNASSPPQHINPFPLAEANLIEAPRCRNDTGDDEAHTFLASLLSSVKTEDMENGLYEPSTELLQAFSTLPADLCGNHPDDTENIHPIVKTEPTEPELSQYCPSDELLAALATLPEDLLLSKEVNRPSDHDVRIKEEPLELGYGLNVLSGTRNQHPTFELKPSTTDFRPKIATHFKTNNKRYIKHVIQQEENELSPKRIKTEQ